MKIENSVFPLLPTSTPGNNMNQHESINMGPASADSDDDPGVAIRLNNAYKHYGARYVECCRLLNTS